MAANIEFLDPALQLLFRQLQARYTLKYPKREMALTHTRRTPVEQLLLFVQGRLPAYPGPVVTWKDGFVCKSKHNFDPSHAFDFGIKMDGKFIWDDYLGLQLAVDIPAMLTELGAHQQFRYGGEFKDYFHIELRG